MDNIITSQYQEQLTDKIKILSASLAEFSAPELEVFPSVEQNFRMRAEFRIWHQDEHELYHIMFDPVTKQRYRVDQLPSASKLLNKLMLAIMPLIAANPILKYKLFQIDYLTTLNQKALISLIYHKQLDQDWLNAAKQMHATLAKEFDLHIIGRAKNQKLCLEQDFVDEELSVNGKNYIYRQIENCFTQPNADINQKMLAWAIDCTKNSQDDLLELYCGNGNFSIALAQNFRRVLATEIAKPSVNAANFNLSINNITNVDIVRISAEEFTQAMNGVRKFRRLADIDLTSFKFSTVLVDPPRSGLDQDGIELIQQYPFILYISCNPTTLCANLATLTQSHKIVRAALFDQFPYTNHIETGVFLVRKDLA